MGKRNLFRFVFNLVLSTNIHLLELIPRRGIWLFNWNKASWNTLSRMAMCVRWLLPSAMNVK